MNTFGTLSTYMRTYLADNVAWLHIADGLHELLHSGIVVALGIEVVSVLLPDVRNTGLIQSLGLGHVQRNEVLRPAVEQLEFVRSRFLF